MKIDQAYLKNLVLAFYDSPKLSITIDDLKDSGFDYDSDEFKHHMFMLHDKGLIKSLNDTPGFGLNNRGGWVTTKLRLTADGQDFAEALKNDTVWNMLQEKFNSAGLDALTTAAKEGLKILVSHNVKDFLS